jgi:hypothetical protein
MPVSQRDVGFRAIVSRLHPSPEGRIRGVPQGLRNSAL